jgi:hypothetical protein
LEELKNPHLYHYLQNGFWLIEGYCMVDTFRVIDIIDSSGINNKGGVCEIGVHHGRFYMMLNATTDSHEKSYAVDVFENQELNIDNSGKGSRVIFENNIRNLDKHQGSNTNIIVGDSTDSALDLVNRIGPGTLRYVSIDGGHTVEHTLNDLAIAEKLVRNEGVVVLDDIMHYCWLGVVEAAVKYLDKSPTLVPFAIGQNKLYMCKLSYHKKYLELFRDSYISRKWPQKICGYEIVTM